MARRRALEPSLFVHNSISSMLNRGMSPNAVYNEVVRQFPNVNKNKVRSEIAQRRVNSSRVEELNRYISGKTRTLKFLKDCGPNQTMRMRFLVDWTDPQTGLKQSFGQTVNLRANTPPEDWIQRGINAVRRRAVNNGYQMPSDQDLVRQSGFKISVTGVECR